MFEHKERRNPLGLIQPFKDICPCTRRFFPQLLVLTANGLAADRTQRALGEGVPQQVGEVRNQVRGQVSGVSSWALGSEGHFHLPFF